MSIIFVLTVVLMIQLQEVVSWTKPGVVKLNSFVALTTSRDRNRNTCKLKGTASLPWTPSFTKRETTIAGALSHLSSPSQLYSSDALLHDQLLPETKNLESTSDSLRREIDDLKKKIAICDDEIAQYKAGRTMEELRNDNYFSLLYTRLTSLDNQRTELIKAQATSSQSK